MKLILDGEPKEIADLVLEIQGRQGVSPYHQISETIKLAISESFATPPVLKFPAHEEEQSGQ